MFRDEKLKQAESEMIKEFCDRKASTLVRKSPEEIIEMFLDWQYRRFKVMPSDIGYFIVDFMDPGEPVAYVSNKDPNAYQDIYVLCDRMNEFTPIKDSPLPIFNGVYSEDDEEDLERYAFAELLHSLMNQEEEE